MRKTDNPYFVIFSEFERHKIKYLIVGGYAAILHGANRMTKDMDIIVDLAVSNLRKCLDVLKRNDFLLSHQNIKENEVTPENILKWKRKKNMKALRFENRIQQFLMIDIILDLPKRFNILYKNRFHQQTKENTLCFISKQDLVEMKSKAGRLQDYQDNFSMTGKSIWLDKLRDKFVNEGE